MFVDLARDRTQHLVLTLLWRLVASYEFFVQRSHRVVDRREAFPLVPSFLWIHFLLKLLAILPNLLDLARRLGFLTNGAAFRWALGFERVVVEALRSVERESTLHASLAVLEEGSSILGARNTRPLFVQARFHQFDLLLEALNLQTGETACNEKYLLPFLLEVNEKWQGEQRP